MARLDEVPSTSGRKAPYKGKPARTGDKPTCSIPAKYETVLFTGPRERKGFGSEGRRFTSDETDNPGPGSYGCQNALLVPESQESISKKGFGPLASRSNRFRNRVRYTGPGPGTYSTSAGHEPFFHVSATSSFHPKVPKVKDVSKPDAPLPGPGAYNSTITRTGKTLDLLTAPNSHNSAFKAPGHKVTLVGNVDTPGPTKYSLTDPWEVGSKGGGAAGSRGGSYACTSSFAGRSVASLSTIPPVVFLDNNNGGNGGKPDTGPSPASYSQEMTSFKTALTKAAAKPSAVFRPPEYVDRMGNSLQAPMRPAAPSAMHIGTGERGVGENRAMPGPWEATHTPGVSAPFKSKAPGHSDYSAVDMRDLARAPGPAYYRDTTAPPSSKSFHVNAKKTFVGMA